MYQSVEKVLRSVPGGVPLSAEQTAFPIRSIPQILEIVSDHQWILLGGDVLTPELKYTYDNWYYNPDANISLSENVKRSIQKSDQYISEYSKRNGGHFLYALVISNAYIEGKRGSSAISLAAR